jgi:hypothetical protein
MIRLAIVRQPAEDPVLYISQPNLGKKKMCADKRVVLSFVVSEMVAQINRIRACM